MLEWKRENRPRSSTHLQILVAWFWLETFWGRLSGAGGLAQLPCGPLLYVLHGFSAWAGQSLTKTQSPEEGNPSGQTALFIYNSFWSVAEEPCCGIFCCTATHVSYLETWTPSLELSWHPHPAPGLGVLASATLTAVVCRGPHWLSISHGAPVTGHTSLSTHPTFSSWPVSASPFSMSGSLFLSCK